MLSPAKAGFGLAVLVFASTPAQATVIAIDATVIDVIPGIAGFQTAGSLMGGMSVQAIFGGGLNETVSWVAGIGDSGGAFGSNWSLTINGDTFLTPWVFTNDTGQGLVALTLDGTPGLTVFDRTAGIGTPGSALGRDFAESPVVPGTATYSRQVAIGATPPVGDIWHMLDVRFGQPLFDNFTFLQDTDNDIRRPPVSTPEPATVALLGAAMAFFHIFRRRPE